MIQSSLFYGVLLLQFKAIVGVCERDLTHTTIQTSVFDSVNPSLVVYYDKNRPPLDEFSTKMENFGICVGYFDCSEKVNAKVCQGARLAGIPSVVLYSDVPQLNPYTKKYFREPISFKEQTLDERSVEKFLAKNLPNNVQMVKSVDGSILSSSQPSVLLFTHKSTISLSYRVMSYFYRSSLGFFVVKVSEDDLEDENNENPLSQYGVTSLPSIVVRSTNGQFVPFSGDIKNQQEIIEWLGQYGKKLGADLPSGSSSSSSSSGSSSSSSESEVASLTSEQFGSLFAEDSAYVVVIAPAESTSVPKWWPELSGKCFGAVKSAYFKCGEDSEVSKAYCSAITNSKPLLLVLPYSAQSKKKVSTSPSKWMIQSSADSDSIDITGAIKRAQDSIPENAITILAEHEVETFLGASQATNTISILAISAKSSPTSVFRNVALSVKGKVQMGFLGQPSEMFMERFGIQQPPSVLALIPPTEGDNQFQIMFYDPSMLGPLSYPSIMGFIHAANRGRPSPDGNQDSSSSSSSTSYSDLPNNGPAVLHHVKTVEDWERFCGKQFKGICAIAFMGSPEGVDPVDTAAIEVYKSAIGKVSSSSIYNFLWIDASCQVALSELFEVTGGSTPALVVYSPLKERSAKFIGKFAQSTITGYLEGMATGRVTTFPMKSSPIFEEKDCTIQQETEPLEGFEADDFLAEIQREEAEKAAAIKKALEEEKKQRELEKKASEDKKKKKKKTTTKKSSTKSDL